MATGGFWSNNVNPQDLNRDYISLAVQDGSAPDPIYTIAYDSSTFAKSSKHEYVEKVLKYNRTTLAADITNSATTVTIPSADATKLRVKDAAGQTVNHFLLRINDEEMLITGGSGTASFTVTRGVNSTTAAAATAGASVFVLPVFIEGADYGNNDFEAGTTIFNMTQIFRAEIAISGSAQSFEGVADENKLFKQLAEKDIQIMNDIAQAAYTGIRTGTTNQTNRKMGGLYQYATRSSTASTLNDAFVDTAITSLIEKGASPADMCLALPSGLWQKVVALKTTRIQNGGMSDTSRRIDKNLVEYEYAGATLSLMRTAKLPIGTAVFFDKSRVKLIGVQGRVGLEEPLAKTGDSDKIMKLSEMTMEVWNGAETILWYSNVS